MSLVMRLQAHHALAAHNSVVPYAGGQVEPVTRVEREALARVGEAERDGARDYVDHLVVRMGVWGVNVVRAVGPAIRLQRLLPVGGPDGLLTWSFITAP